MIILAVLLAVFLDIQKDQSLITIENQPTTTTTKVFLPNPASVFCRDQGYRLEIRTDENGGQFGVCVFDDGGECEEWAFYRQECGQEYLKEILKMENARRDYKMALQLVKIYVVMEFVRK